MAKETGTETQLPKGYRWDALVSKDGIDILETYKVLLIHLGSHGSTRVQAIFANATSTVRQPRNLRTLVEAIDVLDWYSAKSEGLGDVYEGLLEKNAEETKSGAGPGASLGCTTTIKFARRGPARASNSLRLAVLRIVEPLSDRRTKVEAR